MIGRAAWLVMAIAGLVTGLLVQRVSGTLCRLYEPPCEPPCESPCELDSLGNETAGGDRFRSPLTQGLTVALFLIAYARYGFTRQCFVCAVFASIMVVVAAVDVRTYSIPNCLVISGATALASLIALGFLPLRPAVMGALAGGLVMLVAAAASCGGMGAGDVKVSFVIGGFVGWPAITLALFAGFGIAAVTGLILMALGLKGRRDPIPFGPFLAAGGIIAQLFGSTVMTWYWSRMFST